MYLKESIIENTLYKPQSLYLMRISILAMIDIMYDLVSSSSI